MSFLPILSLVPVVISMGAFQAKPVEYVQVKSDLYTFEVPKGWLVGDITPWGARQGCQGKAWSNDRWTNQR